MLVDQIEPSLGEVIIVSYDGGSNSESGSYEGNGTAVLDNDCKYEGEFRNGMFHGKGIFTWPRGVKFEGDFEAGQILGKGSYEWSDGSIYVGEVRGGLRHGPGKFTGSSGQVYEGEWASGMRHGKGKIWYNEDRTIVYTVRVYLAHLLYRFAHHIFSLFTGRLDSQSSPWLRKYEVRFGKHLRR